MIEDDYMTHNDVKQTDVSRKIGFLPISSGLFFSLVAFTGWKVYYDSLKTPEDKLRAKDELPIFIESIMNDGLMFEAPSLGFILDGLTQKSATEHGILESYNQTKKQYDSSLIRRKRSARIPMMSTPISRISRSTTSHPTQLTTRRTLTLTFCSNLKGRMCKFVISCNNIHKCIKCGDPNHTGKTCPK
jgi:hypothetical protein